MHKLREAGVTKKYADATLEVGKEEGVATVDIWGAFMAYVGWNEGEPLPGSKTQPRSEKLGELLRDGLHPTPKGYQIIYNEVIKAICEHYPELKADALPFVFPPWDAAPKFEKMQ